MTQNSGKILVTKSIDDVMHTYFFLRTKMRANSRPGETYPYVCAQWSASCSVSLSNYRFYTDRLYSYFLKTGSSKLLLDFSILTCSSICFFAFSQLTEPFACFAIFFLLSGKFLITFSVYRGKALNLICKEKKGNLYIFTEM